MTSPRGLLGERGPIPRGDVAIIGMACIFPGAPDLETYWQNIVSGVDGITDVPEGRWDPEVFFDPDATAADRLYCKRGGYLGNLAKFNPVDYGIMPIVVDGGEPEQFLSLRVAHEALADAGYADRPFSRERTEVIIGRGNYPSRGNINLTMHTLWMEQTLQILRKLNPEYTDEEIASIKGELQASLPHFGRDTAASLIPNFTTGRIANRLDLMGVNFTIDAACASALIATDQALRDLLTQRCDLALVGGVHVAVHVPFLAVFCQLDALSKRSQIRPFDKDADGTLPGEGVGVVVLKRLEDAERDGDRIYAAVKAVGTASDGRGEGLLTPRVEGEELAVRRAYEMAEIAPATVELVEAHGTGTPVGDRAEIEALTRVFGMRKGALPTCAVGSVKSMIGHTMPAAGIAGLIKTALALYYKVLPPTLNCETPNPELGLQETPLYINTETRPWIHGREDAPRRAGVNAFGFGGINAHVILEEHPVEAGGRGPGGAVPWETEVCLLRGDSRQDLIENVTSLERCLDAAPAARLEDLAFTLNTGSPGGSSCLAVVASSLPDLRDKLAGARKRLEDRECRRIKDVRGIYFFEEPFRPDGKVAFLFPGEAAQYPNMLKDLCLHFPEVRQVFDKTDQLFMKEDRQFLPSQCVFPIPGASDAERLEMDRRLWEMGGALEAILTANWALYELLLRLDVRPDVLLGHSSGEYSALAASGILPRNEVLLESLVPLSAAYERLTAEGTVPRAALAAVGADRSSVEARLKEIGARLFLSMDNCPHQVVIAGEEEAVDIAIGELRSEGLVCQRLPFDRAYHTPMFEAALEPLREFFQSSAISGPQIEIYSASTARPYPKKASAIRDLAVRLWSRPVEFKRSIEALYESGVRIFVEAGPRGNLTSFVEDTLRGRPHLAIGCDVPHRAGITQLNHLIGVLAAQGVEMRLDYLYEHRSPQLIPLDGSLTADGGSAKDSSSVELALDLPTMQIAAERVKPLAPRSGADASREASLVSGPPARPFAWEQDLADVRTPEQGSGDAVSEPLGLRGIGAVGHSEDVDSQVMQEHLEAMNRFLTVEREVMEAYLGGVEADPGLATTGTPSAATLERAVEDTGSPPGAADLPFVGTIISYTPESEVVFRRRIDPNEDVFLLDHCFGSPIVSDVDKTLKPMPVLPFTFCIEIMAEAASLLMPGKLFTGMRNVQISQWVEVESPVTLEVTARIRDSAEEVEVQIRNFGGGEGGEGARGVPVVEGTVIFGPGYRSPRTAAALSLNGERPCRYTAEEMYERRLMFHGPRFRGVASLDRTGENGLTGHLRVLPSTDLFRSTSAPNLLTDPVLLDAAGQLLGYWATEHLDSGYVAFPIRLGALEVYVSHLSEYTGVRCEVEIQQVTPQQLRANMSLFSSDGQLLVRLIDWEDWRFYWPRELYDFMRLPREYLWSRSWEAPLERLPTGDRLALMRLDPTPETTRPIVLNTLAYTILSRTERGRWKGLQGPEVRRTEWLLARITAKDAVRKLLRERYGMDVRPADIEIGQDDSGRPFASVLGLGESAVMPSISLAHKKDLVVALAGYCSEGESLGIDIEAVRPWREAAANIAFSAEELRLLDSAVEADRDEWATRFWCAKEASAKALGRGLKDVLRSLAVSKIDPENGIVDVVLGGRLAAEFPGLVGAPLAVSTVREGDFVTATTLVSAEARA